MLSKDVQIVTGRYSQKNTPQNNVDGYHQMCHKKHILLIDFQMDLVVFANFTIHGSPHWDDGLQPRAANFSGNCLDPIGDFQDKLRKSVGGSYLCQH